MEYRAKSKKLKQLATDLLSAKKIEPCLSQFGQIYYTGSYITDLMCWPDIDLQIKFNHPEKKVKEILRISEFYLHDSDINSIKLINFNKRKKPGMPLGVYMGMEVKSNNLKWKIDIWGLEEEHLQRNLDFMHQINKRLTPSLHDLILKLKFKLMGTQERMPQMASYYLYQAILFESITDEFQIMNYLKSQGVKLD